MPEVWSCSKYIHVCFGYLVVKWICGDDSKCSELPGSASIGSVPGRSVACHLMANIDAVVPGVVQLWWLRMLIWRRKAWLEHPVHRSSLKMTRACPGEAPGSQALPHLVC